jgi:hypothetical protein
MEATRIAPHQGEGSARLVAREMTIMLGVIAEKRQSVSRWAKDYWIPVGVMLAPADMQLGDILVSDERMTRYYMGRTELTFYAADTEAYIENFNSGAPALYVVLRRDSDGTHPLEWYVQSVTASPHAAQDYEVGSEDIIERLPMPPEIAEATLDFLDVYHVETKFVKRQRDKVDVEEQKFGKQPIFARRGGRSDGELDG